MISCIQHPKYKGVRKPRVNCAACWNIFNRDKIQTIIITLADNRKCYYTGKPQINTFDSFPILTKDTISVVEPQKLQDGVTFEPLKNILEERSASESAQT
jgi:hypothetical protein